MTSENYTLRISELRCEGSFFATIAPSVALVAVALAIVAFLV